MVEQQPGIFREVSNDVDAIEEYSAVCRPRGRFPWRWRCPQPRWALTYIQIWTLASTFLIIIVVAVVASLWARLPFPHFHTLIYIYILCGYSADSPIAVHQRDVTNT
jgi:hypothetical protein